MNICNEVKTLVCTTTNGYSIHVPVYTSHTETILKQMFKNEPFMFEDVNGELNYINPKHIIFATVTKKEFIKEGRRK